MLAKRVVAISRDKSPGKRILQAAMAAGAQSELVATVDDLNGRYDATMYVVVMTDAEDHGLQKLFMGVGEGTTVIPIIPRGDLSVMTRLLFRPQVPAVLTLDTLDVADLTAIITKALRGDLFGLDKVLPWGVKVYSILVADYQEKALAIAQVSEFAGAMGVRRKYRESIEQVLDELLMNALYDAPVDEQGKSLFSQIAVKDRITMRGEERVVVQYACDGFRFALSVRDAYGSLRKPVVLQFLEKCLHTAGIDQIDRKESGAGLGLYLVASCASRVAFHILPGVATEVVCTFDLAAAKVHIGNLGLFDERLSHASGGPGDLVSRRRRHDDLPPAAATMPPMARALPFALVLASALLVFAIVLFVTPLLSRPALASLIVETDPPGASIYIDGRGRGVTSGPMRIDQLEAGRTYALRAAMPGHNDEEVLVHAQKGDQRVRLRFSGSISGNLKIESDPQGAEILIEGKSTGKVTPATLDLPPGQTTDVVLRKQGFSDQTLRVVAGALGERAVYRGVLPLSADIASLAIDVDADPAVVPTVTIDGLALMPPGRHHDTLVKPRVPHRVEVTARGYSPHSEEVRLEGGQRSVVRVSLDPGGSLVLKTNLAARVFVDGQLVGDAPVEMALKAGPHLVALRSSAPFAVWEDKIEVERGRATQRNVEFGSVKITAPGINARLPGGPAKLTEFALPVGARKVTLVGPGGAERERELQVKAGARLVIDSL